MTCSNLDKPGKLSHWFAFYIAFAHDLLSTADFNGATLSAGIYFYYLLNEGDILSKAKMAVIPWKKYYYSS